MTITVPVWLGWAIVGLIVLDVVLSAVKVVLHFRLRQLQNEHDLLVAKLRSIGR